jgi:hypothetical protein
MRETILRSECEVSIMSDERWSVIILAMIFIVLVGLVREAAEIAHYLSILASPPR